MNIEDFRNHCLAVKGAVECFPFGDDTLVYKVMGKVFTYAGLTPRDGRFIANMKCDPERSAALRERYEGIFFGPHSDKKYWITVALESDVPDRLIAELLLHSVDEVVRKLPRKAREAYRQIPDEEK